MTPEEEYADAVARAEKMRQLAADMEAAGCKTLGEYVSWLASQP